MNGLKQTCDCGHDIDTHFLDEDKWWDPNDQVTKVRKYRGACLGMRCDCGMYRDPGTPDPTKKPVRPAHAAWCECRGCRPFR